MNAITLIWRQVLKELKLFQMKENSNNSSTVNNYYQQDKQEPATASTNASQPVNVTVPVVL